MVEKKENQGEHLTSGPTINVKDATGIAARYLTNIVGSVRDVRVEEVEKNEATERWVITLGYLNQADSFMAETKYKEFEISTVNGKVFSMKIKKIG